jgi:hypothetical protein
LRVEGLESRRENHLATLEGKLVVGVGLGWTFGSRLKASKTVGVGWVRGGGGAD